MMGMMAGQWWVGDLQWLGWPLNLTRQASPLLHETHRGGDVVVAAGLRGSQAGS